MKKLFSIVSLSLLLLGTSQSFGMERAPQRVYNYLTFEQEPDQFLAADLQALKTKFTQNPNNEDNNFRLSYIYYLLGYVTAKFYQQGQFNKEKLRNTTYINNLTPNNISWRRPVLPFPIINVESSEQKQGNISQDLEDLLVKPGQERNINSAKWYSIVAPSYILGFLKAYPAQYHLDIFYELKEQIGWSNNQEIMDIIGGTLEKKLLDGKKDLHIVSADKNLMGIVGVYTHVCTNSHDNDDTELTDYFINSIHGARDSDGNTALHEAAYYGDYGVVQLLIHDIDSDIEAENYNGETPIDKARYANHKNIVTDLEKHQAWRERFRS